MALGNIYEADERAPGRDLHATVTLTKAQLGHPVQVEVPLHLPVEGGTVERVVGPGETGAYVTINMPTTLVSGTHIRLRGQGEMGASGRAGDLYLEILVTEAPPPKISRNALIALCCLALVVLAWVNAP